MSLVKKTMIAYLKIEMLGMASKDRVLTDDINKAHLQTSAKAGYYQKCKIDRSSVSKIISTTQHAREVHKTLTTTFGDDGWRLLPAVRIKEYTAKMHTAKMEFEAAVHDVEARWPVIIADQYKRLKSQKKVMFDPDDYPFVKKSKMSATGYVVQPNVNLMKHYKFDFELRPTPDQGHVVVDIEKQTILEIKENLKVQEQINLEKSKLELWRRLIEPVKNMADICGNDKKVFKSLVKNIEEEIKILKALNVTNDIDMTNAFEEVRQHLTGYTPGQIRDDKRLKKDLGKKAENLSNMMSSYMGGPQK
jgi:flagellar basal body rod protein FlgC